MSFVCDDYIEGILMVQSVPDFKLHKLKTLFVALHVFRHCTYQKILFSC